MKAFSIFGNWILFVRKRTINPKTRTPYTIDDVPSVIRADVEKILSQDA